MAAKPERIKIVAQIGEITIAVIDPFEGKNVMICRGFGPDDPNCLENNPLGREWHMIDGNICGAGIICRGDCHAVFAKPEEYPEFFENQLELLPRSVEL